MSASYIAMWVKFPLPVTSPTPQTLSAARIRSSVFRNRADGSSPIVSRPRSPRRAARPVAISSFSPVTVESSERETVNVSPEYETRCARTPVRNFTPSRARAAAATSDDSGSSIASSLSLPSMIVTATPNRAMTWESSRPIAPPPSTSKVDGRDSASTASRFVQYGVPASPSIGGITATVPVAMTRPRLAAYS